MWSKLVQPAYDSLSWDYWFGQVDARPLGVFRIVFAILLLKDAVYRLLTATLFYSDTGIAPRPVMAILYRDARWSLMDALGADWQVILFILLWIAVLIGLLLGFQTRVMTILNWILILSIHERNPFLLSGADSVMRVMSIWIIFLPLGRAYSLDRILKPQLPETVLAFPLRMVQLQFAFIYLATFILKAHGAMWLDGSAIYAAMQLRSFTHPIADTLVDHAPYVLFQLATIFTLVAEGCFFPLVFLPFEQPYLKAIGLLAVGMVHVGVGLLMAVPNFSLIMIACYLLFFDGTWIVSVGRRLFPDHTFKAIPVLAPALPIRWREWLIIFITGGMLFNVYAYNFYFMRPDGEKSLGLPISLTQLHTIELVGLWQSWDMFAPNPFQIDGAMLVIGTYENEEQAELRTGLSRDALPRFYFGTGGRWKKYDETVYYKWYPTLIDAHARYRCSTTPDDPQKGRLIQVEMLYRYREISDYGEPQNPYTDRSLWTIACEG